MVAITEDLFHTTKSAGLPIGVSVLCPGGSTPELLTPNAPAELGERPDADATNAVITSHLRRALAEGATPAYIADKVFDAVSGGCFWVIPQQEFLDLAVDRWGSIAEHSDPVQAEQVPACHHERSYATKYSQRSA